MNDVLIHFMDQSINRPTDLQLNVMITVQFFSPLLWFVLTSRGAAKTCS
jgi:hypothetical protein